MSNREKGTMSTHFGDITRVEQVWERMNEYTSKRVVLDREFSEDTTEYLHFIDRIRRIVATGKSVTGRPSCSPHDIEDIRYYPEERMFRVFYAGDEFPIRVPRSLLTKSESEIRELVQKWHDMVELKVLVHKLVDESVAEALAKCAANVFEDMWLNDNPVFEQHDPLDAEECLRDAGCHTWLWKREDEE